MTRKRYWNKAEDPSARNAPVWRACLVAAVALLPGAALGEGRHSCREVDVRIAFDPDPVGDGVRVRLPFQSDWTLVDGDFTGDADCPEEVRTTDRVTVPVAHPHLPSDARRQLEEQSVQLRVVRLSAISASGLGALRASQDRRLAYVQSNGVDAPGGYLHVPQEKADAVGGVWLLPEAYPDETGDRIILMCALTCDASYRLRPGLSLNYQLMVDDRDKPRDWVAIDRILRAAIAGWIVPEPADG